MSQKRIPTSLMIAVGLLVVTSVLVSLYRDDKERLNNLLVIAVVAAAALQFFFSRRN